VERAGAKYIVITAKHHDGFALYPSAVTDWDVADATPWKRDLLTPLAEAVRRHGLKFGTYYSQAQDWVHPGGAKWHDEEGGGWDEAHKGSFDDYLRTIALPQVEEILERFHPDILWWDTPRWMTPERARPFHELVAKYPDLITNNRLGGGYEGDTETPEQHIPATGYPDGRDWETCMTMNDTWGYKSYDNNWKSVETLIRNLVDIVSKGGNYLLNIGPTAEGEIPPESIDRLEAIGAWMRVNGEAIYGTRASPFVRLPWGRATRKETDDGGLLYLHVFHWPEDGRLVVPGLRSPVESAHLLADGRELPMRREGEDIVLDLPEAAPDPVSSTIVLRYRGALDVHNRLPGPDGDGRVRLTAEWTDIHNTIRTRAHLEGHGASARIEQWDHPEARLTWDFETPTAGTYAVKARVGAGEGGTVELLLGTQRARAEIEASADGRIREVALGRITVTNAGRQLLEMRPVRGAWKGSVLYEVVLEPVDPEA